MDLAGKRVVVVGLAQTGIAVAEFARDRGAKVTVTDGKTREQLALRLPAVEDFATLELGGMNEATFTSADLVVMSPGVPELPQMRAARAAGVEVIAEIELAYRFFHPGATLIAITGTNGKSTTTALTGTLCEASGRPTFCGGNLGNHPLIEAVDHPANSDGGLIVAEVAGFMLETCVSFRPDVAACLNITEDHLDRFGTMETYAAVKSRIYAWQESSDVAIANALDPLVMSGAKASQGQLYTFDSQNPSPRGAHLSEDKSELILELDSGTERYPASDLPIIGTHNLENAMVAYLAARLAGVKGSVLGPAARTYVSQRHRMERIGERSGVLYFDDSKGTNVAAVAASMTGFPHPAVLIAGGVDKGGSYEAMFQALDGVARGLVLIGEAAALIRAAAEAHGADYPVIDATSMEEAVTKAAELARPGDAVVLSPACSSYDMFKNFGQRGMAFRAAVAGLPKTGELA